MEWIILSQLFRGKTLVRAMMNAHSENVRIEGHVVDIGGGEGPSYLSYLQGIRESFIENIDLYKPGPNGKRIDLESDTLPYTTGSIDTVLLFNVLEHIFNIRHLLSEVARVLKKEGRLVGFIPFLVNYHADPHDYVRLTHEALTRYFAETGFQKVEVLPIGFGPFAVNLNTLSSLLSGPWWAFLYPLARIADAVLLSIRPNLRTRFPLGYFFIANK